MPMGLGTAVVFYRWSTGYFRWSENGGNSTHFSEAEVCSIVILFSMDGLNASRTPVEVIDISAGNELRAGKHVSRNSKMSFYSSFTKRFLEGDLLEALKAYDVWLYLAWLDVRLRYRRSKIGPLWITLSMTIFCLTLGGVYSRLLNIEIGEYLPFLSISFVIWGLISSLLLEFPNLYVDNSAYIKDVRINALTILLRGLMRNALVFAHNILIILGIYAYFDLWPGFVFLLAIPGLILVLLNLFAIGVSLSIIGARFRDIAQINQSLVQILFFLSPIMWFPRLVSSDSLFLRLNPITYFLDLVRSPLLGSFPSASSWYAATAMLILFTTASSILYLKKSSKIPLWV
jgi:ABC-type polysaccharide/polyol phosphate export permease